MQKGIIQEELQCLVADIGANPHSEEMAETLDKLSERIILLFGVTSLNKILNKCYDEINNLGGNFEFLKEFDPVEINEENHIEEAADVDNIKKE